MQPPNLSDVNFRPMVPKGNQSEMIISMLSLPIVMVESYTQNLIKGAFILFAVLLDQLRKRRG